ncbi:MAG: hypothetical protein RJA70_2745 [Pseudomonadota bacterium]|jgi:tetratricopeptide (TPR) repeat protein
MQTQYSPAGTGPHDTRVLYSRAHSLLTQERFEDAAAFFRLMLILSPESERAWLGLGLCHEKRGQLAVARDLFLLGNAAKPSARCLVAAARLFRQLDQDELAQHHLERAVEVAEVNDESELRHLALLELRN